MATEMTEAPLPAAEPRSARIAQLSVLPVFYELAGKRVMVAGGSEGAAWKAELLAATGARVEVLCPLPEMSEEMAALVASHADGAGPAEEDTASAGGFGTLVYVDARWTPELLLGAALAVGDCESEAEAAAFASAARQAGVPVNVVDKPAFCDFSFGTLVNRSPLVVAISTAGAAPILGQAVRRRIETLLPPALAGWAKAAARIREAATARLAPGPERRAFWERLSEAALSGRQAPASETGSETDEAAALLDAVRRDAASNAATSGGRVTLVGAGPGAAELLTLKAVRALQAADVILFDDLVSDEVLELARREAKRMLVGKRAARESCRQEDINSTMVALAKAGKNVVRLKGGDVAVFGRAGEEIAALKAEGIPVSIVPGITAASALASAFGVSLTHRDHAQELRLVTAHSRHGALPQDLDWPALARPGATTIFYMGGRMAGRIAARLIAEGASPATPVALAADLSREGETQIAGRLADLADLAAALPPGKPVLIAVGDVFEEAVSQSGDASSSAVERRSILHRARA